MIAALGRPGATPLHRLAAGWKLGGLAAIATALFFVADPRLLGLAAALALLAARSTGATTRELVHDLKGAFVVLAAVALVDWAFVDAATGVEVFLRLAALALAAHAVTVTTSITELTEVLERLFAPLDRLGLVDGARLALTITLAIRFVPVIAEEAAEIREAQAARGLDASPIALVVPLMVRVLRRSEDLADAIDARGFPPDRPGRLAPPVPEKTPHDHP